MRIHEEITALGSAIAHAQRLALAIELPRRGDDHDSIIGIADLHDALTHLSRAKASVNGVYRALELTDKLQWSNALAMPTASEKRD